MGPAFDPWRHTTEQLTERVRELALNRLARASGIPVALLADYLAGRPIEDPSHRARLSSALGWDDDAIDALLTGEFATDQPVVDKS